MGELLLEEEVGGGAWSVERRFRVTEVFLAVLWVCIVLLLCLREGGLGKRVDRNDC
jgi:hypothetical protein